MSTYAVEDRTEGKRGCGYRKGGGIYVVSGGIAAPCGRLPIPLTVCPCCSQGIKPSRGWTWVDADKLSEANKCGRSELDCALCPLGTELGRAGLLWVGEQFYPTPGHFSAEAAQMGISRRLSQVPRDFKVGDTWVLMAHRKCIGSAAAGWTAGVFHIFLPTAIEYVVSDEESPAELQKLHDRGFKLVRVHRDDGKRTLHKSEVEPHEEDDNAEA
jgi:hypothetical protein